MSKENLNKFVNSLQQGDAKQAGDELKNALADKVSAALDDAKVDVAKSVFTGQQGADAPEANGSKEKEPTLKPKEGEKDVGRSN